MSQIHVRSFAPEMRSAVVALWQRVFPDDPPWNEPNLVIDAKLAVDPALFLVAESDGQLAGTAMGGYDGHRGWVYAVAVDPDLRRRGIASVLMESVEEALRERGCLKLNLQVRASNRAVVDFYTTLGYETEERVSMGKLLVERSSFK